MNVENIVRICHPGVPASAGGIPAGAAAYRRERRIYHPGVPASAGCMPAGAAAYWRERPIDHPGVPASAGGMPAGTGQTAGNAGYAIRESRLQPVGCLPGLRLTAGNACSGWSRDSGPV